MVQKHSFRYFARFLVPFAVLAFLAAPPLRSQTSGTDEIVPTASIRSSVQAAGGNAERHDFLYRIAEVYWHDWTGATVDPPDPPRRGLPAPVSSPPFPFSDWPYGGSPTIGAPDTGVGPLMTAIYSGENARFWESSRVKIYGWTNSGFNVSTSDKHYGNAPAAYSLQPNSIQLNQIVMSVERLPDTVQPEHFDWGFRVTHLYGLDYRFTTAKGYFSQQLLHDDKHYGYDPLTAYVDLYWGQIAHGMNVRIGRYISLPDIEGQLAPYNYTYSHSLLFAHDASTQTGINTTTRLSEHWTVQLGISAGNDVAPWVGEPNAKPTFNTCVGYTWSEGRDNLYACDNSTNSGKYAYNNLQAYYLTWYHRFSNSSWHTASESWYMWQKQVPNVDNPDATPLLITGANGAICNSPSELACYAPEWAVVNYLEKQFSNRDYLSIRNEYFNDMRGQRTGFRTSYSEHLIGWGHWIGSSMLIRPELRFEHSYGVPAYNLGTRNTQLIFAGDVILHF